MLIFSAIMASSCLVTASRDEDSPLLSLLIGFVGIDLYFWNTAFLCDDFCFVCSKSRSNMRSAISGLVYSFVSICSSITCLTALLKENSL